MGLSPEWLGLPDEPSMASLHSIRAWLEAVASERDRLS